MKTEMSAIAFSRTDTLTINVTHRFTDGGEVYKAQSIDITQADFETFVKTIRKAIKQRNKLQALGMATANLKSE